MMSLVRHRKMDEPIAKKEKDNEGAFDLTRPLQGFTVSGVNIVSCVLDKINGMWSYTNNDARPRETLQNENSGTISPINIALGVYEQLKARLNHVFVQSVGRLSTAKNDQKKSDEAFAIESKDENCDDEKNNNNNRHQHGKNNAFLKHSHSQSCMTACRHKHHKHITSWRHPMSVHRSHVPNKLQEPYIEYGYLLPFMPWRYYLKGLYTPSYELMNVWTHLIPSIYFSYLLFVFSKEMDIFTAWPLFFMTLSGAMLSGFSAMAHLFHSRSSLHHSCWFVADYFGITFYAFASLATNFYSGALLEYYNRLSEHYLIICLLIACVGYSCLCVTQTEKKWVSTKVSRLMKVGVNFFGYMFGAIPLFIRMYENFMLDKSETALRYHFLAIIFMMSAPTVYGTDFPQCMFPGTFDVFGHSHMWFHILSATAAYYNIHAVYYDVKEGPWNILHKQANYPTFYYVVICYAVLIMYGYIAGRVTHTTIKDEHAHERPYLEGKHLCACGLPETANKLRLMKSKSTSSIEHIVEE